MNEKEMQALLRKTQAFSDAGPVGNGKAMAALADPRLIFFNENGDRATRDDLASIKPAPSNGVTTRMSVTDWDCQVHGDVAVTSFVDNAARTDTKGKTVIFRYRSVETWLHRSRDWTMIGSETVALADDPDDRRSKIVVISEQGSRMREHARQAVMLMRQELARRIGADKLEALSGALAADWGEPMTFEAPPQALARSRA